MSTLTVSADDLATLLPGDRIVALDDHLLPQARTVLAPGADSVEVENTLGSGTTWKLYSHACDSVTVERPGTAAERPARSRRATRRTLSGLTFVSLGGEHWQTLDGSHRLSRQESGITFCDAPHPVRISRGMERAALEEPTNPWWNDVRRALRAGKRGYLCDGFTEHPGEPRWYVLSDDPRVENHLDSYATMTEAAGALASRLSELENR